MSLNNSRPSIYRLPRIFAPLTKKKIDNRPPQIIAPPPVLPFLFLLSGISIVVNLDNEAEMESDPVKVIVDDLDSDA